MSRSNARKEYDRLRRLPRKELAAELRLCLIRDFNVSGYDDGTVIELAPLIRAAADVMEAAETPTQRDIER